MLILIFILSDVFRCELLFELGHSVLLEESAWTSHTHKKIPKLNTIYTDGNETNAHVTSHGGSWADQQQSWENNTSNGSDLVNNSHSGNDNGITGKVKKYCGNETNVGRPRA
jgi:hypothetical protein